MCAFFRCPVGTKAVRRGTASSPPSPPRMKSAVPSVSASTCVSTTKCSGVCACLCVYSYTWIVRCCNTCNLGMVYTYSGMSSSEALLTEPYETLIGLFNSTLPLQFHIKYRSFGFTGQIGEKCLQGVSCTLVHLQHCGDKSPSSPRRLIIGNKRGGVRPFSSSIHRESTYKPT